MTRPDTEFNLEVGRRKLLAAAGIGGGAVVAASFVRTADAEVVPSSGRLADPQSPVTGLHLQFGADASSEMVMSWHTLRPVRIPRVILGGLDGKLEQTAEAKTTCALASPVLASVSVRMILSAYTTRLPCSPFLTRALNSRACLKVSQIGAAYPFAIAADHSIRTLMPASNKRR